MADTDLQTAVVHKLLMLVLDQSISNFYFQIKELLVRVIHMTVVVLDFPWIMQTGMESVKIVEGVFVAVTMLEIATFVVVIVWVLYAQAFMEHWFHGFLR